MRAIKGTDIETVDVLVQRMLSGSTAAFDRLYERYFPRVYGFVARRISPESEVEDVVQTVFTHALVNFDSYRSEGTFIRWLYGITRNVLRRRYLKQSRARKQLGGERLDVNESPDLLKYELTPEREAAAREIGRRVVVGLEKLNENAREIFLLHHLDGLSITELSERTDRSEDSLKSDFYRIRRKLAEDT